MNIGDKRSWSGNVCINVIDDAEVLKEIKLESELSVGVFRAWILGAPADSGAMFWLCAAVALFAAVTFSACVTTLEAMRIAICPTRPVNLWRVHLGRAAANWDRCLRTRVLIAVGTLWRHRA
jgi:hypothetical protein